MPNEHDTAAKPAAANMSQPPAATLAAAESPSDAEFVAAFVKSAAAIGKAPTQYVNVRAGDLARLTELAARAVR